MNLFTKQKQTDRYLKQTHGYQRGDMSVRGINEHKHSTIYKIGNQQGDQPVNPKGNQPWIFIGRTDAKAEAPTLWPPNKKSQLIGKNLDAGRGWGQMDKGAIEDEMAGWHNWLNGHEAEHTPGDSEGQGRTPGVLLSIGLQRVGRDVVTKQQQQIRYNTGNSTQYSVITYMRKGASLVAQTVKNLPAVQGALGLIPGSGRSPGEGNGNPLWYSCLGNPMDRGAWQAVVHGVAKSWTGLSDILSYLIGENNLKMNGYMYIHNWIMLLYPETNNS